MIRNLYVTMVQGRWTPSEEHIARETYAVLICGQKATRAYTRSGLRNKLTKATVYGDFLKLCVEYDDSKDLKSLRRGLLLVVQANGITEIAKKAGFSRVSLYRMLSKNGNPRLKNLISLFHVLKLRFWLVENDFVQRRERFKRPKDDEAPSELPYYLKRPAEL